MKGKIENIFLTALGIAGGLTLFAIIKKRLGVQ